MSMKQADMANIIGVTQSTISSWLNGRNRPSGLKAKAFKKKFPEIYEEVMDEYWRVDSEGEKVSP